MKKILLLVVSVFSIQLSIMAADASLSGTVANASTREFLRYASVEIPALSRSASTDELGRYTFDALPAGTHEIVVNYSGLVEQRKTVEIAADQSATADFDLLSADAVGETITLEKFTVTGERESTSASIMRQMASEDVRSVASFGSFGGNPTESTGELLIRLPGVAGELNEEGDVTGVAIRGFNSSFNLVSVDGVMQVGSGMSRGSGPLGSGVIFDEVEIIKGFTPENAAGSLSGAVNIRTRNILSTKQRHRTYWEAQARAAVTPLWDYIPMRKDHPIHGYYNLSHQSIFDVFGGKRNLGIMVNLLHRDNVNGSFGSHQDYYSFREDSPVLDPNPVWRIYNRDFFNHRSEETALFRVEYSFNKNHNLYFVTRLTDNFERNHTQYQFYADVTGGINNTGNIASNINTATLSSDWQEVINGRFWMNNIRYSYRGRAQSYLLGGNHSFSRFKLDWKSSYNRNRNNMGNGEDPGGFYAFGVSTGGWTLDKTHDDRNPTITQTSGKSIHDVSTFSNRNNVFRMRDDKRNGSSYAASANLQYALPLSIPVVLKSGVAYNKHKLSEISNNSVWTHNADLTPFLTSDRVSFENNVGGSLPFVDTAAIRRNWALVTDNGRINNAGSGWYQTENNYFSETSEDLMRTRSVSEEVTAAYIQGQLKYRQFSVLTGVRFERTQMNGQGYFCKELVPESVEPAGDKRAMDSYEFRKVDPSFNNYLPSIHFTWNLSRETKLRAAWSTSMARAPIIQYTPGYVASSTTYYVYAYNPNLVPQESYNIDLEFSYAPKHIASLFTATLFRKDVKKFIYNQRGGAIDKNTPSPMSPTTDPTSPDFIGFPSTYWNAYEVESIRNGGKATIHGLELAASCTSFVFLPQGFLRGFGGFVNFTILDTSGDYGEGERTTKYIAGFTPRTANAGITYTWRKFSGNIRLNYTGKSLHTYSSRSSDLIYTLPRTVVDVGFEYKWRTYANFYCNIRNIFNAPNNVRYQDRKHQIWNYNETAPYIECGVRGSF